MVEMALILPLLIMLTFAIVEYGWMFFRASQVNQAARHGARIAVRPAATVTEVNAAVATVMSSAGMSSGYTVTIAPADLSAAVGDLVSVQVSIGYSSVSLTGGGFVPVPQNLTGAVTMAKEGPS